MHPKPARPTGITLLSILFMWIGGFGTLFFPIVFLTGDPGMFAKLFEAQVHWPHLPSLAIATTFLVLMYAAYLLYLCIGIGLWKLKLLALKAIIAVQWFGIGIGIIASLILLRYQPLLALGEAVWCIGIFSAVLWYLTRPAVRWPFDVTYAAAHSLAIPPSPPPAAVALRLRVAIGLGITVVIITTSTVALISFVDKTFRSSEVYKLALTQAQNSPCIIASLGVPIEAKGSITGSIPIGSDDGPAELDIPLHGPRSEGTLHVKAIKRAGPWIFADLSLYSKGGQIHVLPTPSPCR